MVRVRLRGIASATKRLADGSKRTYYYAWRGGPKLEGVPGSPEFMAAYHAANADLRRPPPGVLFTLISEYRSSAEYGALAPSTRRAYAAYLKTIEVEFGSMPIEALDDPRARGAFKTWRDGMAATPRKADYAWVTLAKVLAFAKDRGRIRTNVCERGGRLYGSTRVDKVWTEANLAALLEVAPAPIRQIVTMALWTGQRQGDLLTLTWRNIEGRYVVLRQSKTGRLVTIPIGTELRRVLDECRADRDAASAGSMPDDARTILTNTRGLAWTSDGFRTSWAAAVARAGLAGVDLHFHDLRGTAVTRLGLAGCTEAEIATITGLSMDTVRTILDRHYLNRDVRLAESAIRKLERNEKRTRQGNGKGTKVANRSQTGTDVLP